MYINSSSYNPKYSTVNTLTLIKNLPSSLGDENF